MPRTDIFQKDELYFVPLGGSEQFGVNLNLYVNNDEFLIVDCGLGFADERFPGIDLLLPDPALIEENMDKVKGMIITHAHEDHIGALSHLWDRFDCPVYTTPFTGAVLKRKLKEIGVRDPDLNLIRAHETVQIGSFGVSFVPVSHSVPGSCSLMIRTDKGNTVHSGDWNLDPAPVVGLKTEAEHFRKLGDENVLAYVGDSTNATVEGSSGSEAEVAEGLAAEFKKCEGRIAVTIFSSNIGRIVSISEAAKQTGRHVAIFGRSLKRMVCAAQECGYLEEIDDFVSEDDIGYLPDEKTVLILTGSQGEYRSALARIARGDHKAVSLQKGDTVIFSARAIPGNERNINTVKNNLVASGINVITPQQSEHKIHVSGHPCRAEIEQMLQWLRPSCVIPVHGERLQLEAHAELAKQCQVKNAIVPSNGSVIRLAPGPVEIVDNVETGLLAVDQGRIIPASHHTIIARRKLQYSGAIHLSLVLNEDLELIGKMRMDVIGIGDGGDQDKFEKRLKEEVLDILDDIAEDHTIELEEDIVAEELRICLRRYVINLLSIKPKTTVHVTILEED